MRRQHGFTIVELLIVIVVIGILAAITIVAYNGVQQRAKNTQMVAVAKTYRDALLNYEAINGAYPTFSQYAVCLGDGYPSDHCWIGSNGDYSVLASFDTAMKEFIPTKPEVPAKYYTLSTGDQRSGVVYYRNNPSGSQSIDYILDGTGQDCQLSGATALASAGGVGSTLCRVTLPAA